MDNLLDMPCDKIVVPMMELKFTGGTLVVIKMELAL